MLVKRGIGLGCLCQGKTVRDEMGRSYLLQHPPGDLEPTRFAPTLPGCRTTRTSDLLPAVPAEAWRVIVSEPVALRDPGWCGRPGLRRSGAVTDSGPG